MAEALAAPLEFGPEQMMLSAELLQALIAGEAARLQDLLSGEHLWQADGHVAITVSGASPGAAASSPLVGARASSLFGVTSNGNTALHLVASLGHAEVAAVVCEKAPSLVATRNRNLDTPLHCAAKAGHREVAARLLSAMRARGAEEAAALLARNRLGATALYEAVRHARAGVVDLLMTEAPELASLASEDGFSPLYLAASTDPSAKMVRILLRRSQDGTPSPASFKGPDGRSALHVAAATSKEMAQEILNWKPEGTTLLTKVDSSGRTPLQFAVMYGALNVVQLFLDEPTSMEQVHISDSRGLYAVHTAAVMGSAPIIDELIKRCPDYYELVDDKGRNLLHCAVEHDQETVVRHICQNDTFAALLNATDYEGNTPLHLAVKHGSPRIVALLLQTMTVEIGVTNKHGLTAGDLARRALAPGRSYYFLNPHCLVWGCLRWMRAPITSDGDHPLYVDKKLTDLFQSKIEAAGEEASDNTGNDNMTKTLLIASVLIATVVFAAAFTVPGGFVADDHPGAGTATLARRFAFRAFVVSDAMAFVCSIVATSFLTYGGAVEIPRKHRLWYTLLASALVPVAALFMVAAFAFGLQLVLGDANRCLVVFAYAVSLAAMLFCFPGVGVPMRLALAKAVWRRAGWRGLVNVYERPSSLLQLLGCFTTSLLFQNLIRPFSVLLISAAFIVAVALNIALPNY